MCSFRRARKGAVAFDELEKKCVMGRCRQGPKEVFSMEKKSRRAFFCHYAACSSNFGDCDALTPPTSPRLRLCCLRARGTRRQEARRREPTRHSFFFVARWFFHALLPLPLFLSPSSRLLFRASPSTPPSPSGLKRNRSRRRARLRGLWMTSSKRNEGQKRSSNCRDCFFFDALTLDLLFLSHLSLQTTAPGRRRRRAVRHLHQHHHGVG